MMIGYHAVPVIVDAYLKGIGDFNAEKALEACIATANRDDYRGIGDYKKLGYVPAYSDPKKWENWSLSKTLEYAYDDYCIAKMAEKMGKKEIADDSLNVHRIIIMCTIRQLPLCSLVMRKETLPLISAPMIIRKIFARAMVGNISGPCRKIWTV